MAKRTKNPDINSPEYWNSRFESDWIERGGPTQTRFFASIAAQNLPRWLVDEISRQSISFYDYGCALGDSLDVFQSLFPRAAFAGGDVAAAAIETAKQQYPQFNFEVINSGRLDFAADVTFCSNTLEHVTDWRKCLNDIGKLTRSYVIVMAPFQEKELLEEHVNHFDFDDVPFEIGGKHKLAWLKIVDTSVIPQSQWNGRQFIAIWAKKRRPGDITVSDMELDFGSCDVKAARLVMNAFGPPNTALGEVRHDNQRLAGELKSSEDRAKHFSSLYDDLNSYTNQLKDSFEHQVAEGRRIYDLLLQSQSGGAELNLRVEQLQAQLQQSEYSLLESQSVRSLLQLRLNRYSEVMKILKGQTIGRPSSWLAKIIERFGGTAWRGFDMSRLDDDKDSAANVGTNLRSPRFDGGCILLQAESLHRGGLEQVIYDLAKGFRSLERNVVIVGVLEGGDTAEKLLKEGFDVRIIGSPDNVAYEAAVADLKIEVSLLHHSYCGLEVLRQRGSLIIEVVHNYYTWLTGEKNPYGAAAQFIDHYMAVSDPVAEFHRRAFNFSPELVSTIPNPLNITDLIRPEQWLLDRARADRSKRFIFVNASQFHPSKGHLLMLSAMEKLIKTHPQVHLDLIGQHTDQEIMKAVEKKLASNPLLAERVSMPGYLDRRQLSQRLAASHAYVAPSVYEGFSLAVMEACYFGLPSVLTDVGGARKLSEEADCAILVKPHFSTMLGKSSEEVRQMGLDANPENLPDLVSAMRRMVDDYSVWREKGLLGKAWAARRTPANVAASYLDVIASLRASHDRTAGPAAAQ